MNIIVNVLKKDNSSDYALDVRYGKENIYLIKSGYKDKYSHTIENYIRKYGEIEGKIKWGY